MTKPKCFTYASGQADGSILIECAECGDKKRIPRATCREVLRVMKRFRDKHADRHAK